MSIVKERVTQIVQEQPEDASLDDILRELAMLRMIERGLVDSKAGRTTSHEDMRNEIESWHQ